MQFYSYLRVSTTKQGFDGLGIESQREAVGRYCKQAQGELLGEFVEVESGKRNDRPVLADGGGIGWVSSMTEPTMKAHCPRCDGERVCHVHGSFDQPWSDDQEHHSVNGQVDHRLLQCRGCEMVFYWQSSWDSEDFDVRYNYLNDQQECHATIRIETHPSPEKKTQRPDWSWSLYKQDKALSAIMEEVYRASDTGSFILASIGLRTALDRVTETLGIDALLGFDKKVQALFDGGWIGETERLTLDVVADAGSAAAHRGWAPDEEAFRILLTTLEHFIQRAVITGKRALEFAPIVPRKAIRSKKTKLSGEVKG